VLNGLISLLLSGGIILPLFGTLPSTNTYELNSYGFGSGGTANSTTGNFALEGITGEASGQPQNTGNFSTLPGFNQTQQANVPTVAVTNPSSYYDKLHFVINQQSNPTDALYALQVKVNDVTCNYSSGTIQYVKSDNTLGNTLALTDYQTYSTWGGSGGANAIGLAANTTYCIRAKATQGKFTESAYGPSSSAATVGQSISFCLYTTSCGSGNTVSFGSLPVNTPTSGGTTIKTDLATNADFGGNVYIYGANGGLKSPRLSFTIGSATADLASASQGFGAQVPSSPTVTTGGPLTAVSPYLFVNSTSVGAIGTTAAVILTSSNPLTGGNAVTNLIAKTSNTTPSASDYTETITYIAAASF
jgi:hypothetical protein